MDWFDSARRIAVGEGHYSLGVNHHRNRARTNREKVWDRYAGCLVVAGHGTYRDGEGRLHRVAPGCFVHHFPDRYHHIEREAAGWEEYSLLLDRTLYAHLRDLGLVDERCGVQRCGLPRDLPLAFARIARVLERGDESQLRRLLFDAGALLLRVRELAEASAELDEAGALIEQARRRLASDDAAELDLPALASELGMSYPAFRRRFRRQVGASPAAYRTGERMEQAAAMLRFGRASVSAVAERFGFADVFAFSHCFKRHHGLAPRHYAAWHAVE